MIRREVVLSPDAHADLLALYDWIADVSTPVVAAAYIQRLDTFLRGMELASERGTARDDIRPGLRIIGFERRMTIAFTVRQEQVVILRLFHGGRNWGAELHQESAPD